MYKINYIVSACLVIIILMCISHNPHRLHEPFYSTPKLILMGDSILNNNSFVKKNYSVSAIVQKKVYNTVIVAKNNSYIHNLTSQFNKIKEDIHSKTKIFISIGIDDILYYNSHKYINKQFYKNIPALFNVFKTTIEKLFKDTKAQLYFLNIYYPIDNQYSKYYKYIAEWNTLLNQFTTSNSYKIIEIDKLFRHPSDFIESIEPSKTGSQLIANAILKAAK